MGNDVARDVHCDITSGNDVTSEIHCDVIMSNDVAMYKYSITKHNDFAMILFNKWVFDQSGVENTFVVFTVRLPY